MSQRTRVDRKARRPRTLRRWLQSTSRRTFILYPLIIILLEYLFRNGDLAVAIWGIPLLTWGYLQYRLAGNYRTRIGGGGPGIGNPPERLVATGIYALTRNPMYLGHLIFMAGLAVTFRSVAAVALLLFHIPWFQYRVRQDEQYLASVFGKEYDEYKIRVKRWIPGIL